MGKYLLTLAIILCFIGLVIDTQFYRVPIDIYQQNPSLYPGTVFIEYTEVLVYPYKTLSGLTFFCGIVLFTIAVISLKVGNQDH